MVLISWSLLDNPGGITCMETPLNQVTTDTGYPHDGCADNAAYRHDRRADKRRYPHNREIDIQMLKMSRNGYILS